MMTIMMTMMMAVVTTTIIMVTYLDCLGTLKAATLGPC